MKSLFTFLSSKGQVGALILGIIACAIAIGSIIGGIKSNYSLSTDLVPILKNNPEASFDFFNPALYVVIALVAIAAFLMLFFGVMGVFTNPKGSMKGILGLVGILILFFIFYATSTSGMEIPSLATLLGKFEVTENVSKYIDGGIKTAVWGIVLAFAAAAIMEILNLFK